MERKLNLFNDIGRKIEDELDFDFSVSEIRIEDSQSFYQRIKQPFDQDFSNPKSNERLQSAVFFAGGASVAAGAVTAAARTG